MPMRSAPTAALPKSVTGSPAARADVILGLREARPTAPLSATPPPAARMRCTNLRRVFVILKNSDVRKMLSIRSPLGCRVSLGIFPPHYDPLAETGKFSSRTNLTSKQLARQILL